MAFLKKPSFRGLYLLGQSVIDGFHFRGFVSAVFEFVVADAFIFNAVEGGWFVAALAKAKPDYHVRF
jgi:hypothetical protein